MVVLPLVPVIPTVVSDRLGWPHTIAAIGPEREPGVVDDDLGDRADVDGSS